MSLYGTAQEYIYKHYNSKDGLANSTVFQMLQDRDGFIWFATNSGLSRFDGKNFKNFSTLDGLPNNVILRMFEDSRGRIWLMPFKNAISYYYEGKIYSQQNDSVLRKIELDDFPKAVVEDKRKEIFVIESKKIFHIDAQDNVKLIDQKMSATVPEAAPGTGDPGNSYVYFDGHVFSTETKTITHFSYIPEAETLQHLVFGNHMICWVNLNTLHVKSSYYNKDYNEFVGPVNTMYLLNDSMLCINTPHGTSFYNLVQQKIEKRFLPNGNISHFIMDKEGGYWFSTLNDGVFRLGSPMFKSIATQTAAGEKLGVYNFQKFNNEIWAGCDLGRLLKIRNNVATPVTLTVDRERLDNQLVYSLSAKGNRLAAACGNYVFVKGHGDQFAHWPGFGSNKELAWKNDRELVVASSNSLYSMKLDRAKQNTVHIEGRTTCLYYRNDSTWFGTFDRLYLMKPDGSIINLGKDIPLVNVPILSIREGLDGTIWVATNGSGLVGLKNNRVIWHFGEHNGLNSDRVRCIGVDSGFVWVGTNSDLNKISLQPQPAITRYPYSDALNSNIINTLLVDNNIIYGGTPNGIIWFDKRDTLSSSICNLKILGVTVNENEQKLQQNYFLPFKNNNIRFDYAAVSIKSAGDMVFHYRLTGLDSSWKTTMQISLELIALPPGKYKLELFAVNKLNVKSLPYSVNIIVENPFWKSSWFMGGAILLTALIAWFIGTQRNRTIIRKEKLRRLAEQQLLDLEQKALRAQMNPHFIFNCLHSIQGFILDKDPENANRYLSQFASLIRQTLENSFQSFISLADEVKYLSTYLQLEQMRSESKFEYRIETEAGLSTAAVLIPSMILQPFVENAVRHGIQSVYDRAGFIGICFFINEHELTCRIEDNGIGRQQAQRQKNASALQYRSLGMQLTYERIELINTNSVKKITVEIVDKLNEFGRPNGTDVIIKFPIFTGKDNPLS